MPPPPFVTWAESLSTKTDKILLFFALHQFWAGKRTDSEWRNFSFGLHYTQNFCPPPFQNPAYASDCACRSYMPLLRNRCLFFCNGNRIANRIGAYFSKRSHQIIASNHAKESTSIIASENSTKKSVIFVIIFDGSVSS